MDKARLSGDVHVRASVAAMQQVSADDRSTVQALAREIDVEARDGELSMAKLCNLI
jgi:hypothetical protein